MSTDSKIIFNDDCSWPRRLLHVPTMTSHKWKPGDAYGGYIRPKYIAISYTWGRWRLRPGERSDVSAVAIEGVTWPVPRVDPSHFSAAEFANVLMKLNTLLPKTARKVEFVWVDVACIDQNPGSKDSALEIGRQAKIFKKATAVFAWLTSHQGSLNKEWKEIHEIHDFLVQYRSTDPEDATLSTSMELRFSNLIKQVIGDPWFTSLWTLQESFLRQDLIFITRHGQFWGGDDEPWDLSSIAGFFTSIVEAFSSMKDENLNLHMSTGFIETLEATGLIGFEYQGIPAFLLSAAQYRQTSPDNVTDRIYGIMQVFDLRLGKSRPGADAAKDLSLLELEDELGAELMQKQSILSQLYVHRQEPEHGRWWRLGRNCRPPIGLDYMVLSAMRNDPQGQCATASLSSEVVLDEVWGRFEGPVCDIDTFISAWTSERRLDSYLGRHGLKVDLNLIEPRAPDEDNLDLLEMATWDESEAILLMLGMCGKSKTSASQYRHAVCLILVRHPTCAEESENMWRRIGVCLYELASIDEDGHIVPCSKEMEELLNIKPGLSSASAFANSNVWGLRGGYFN